MPLRESTGGPQLREIKKDVFLRTMGKFTKKTILLLTDLSAIKVSEIHLDRPLPSSFRQQAQRRESLESPPAGAWVSMQQSATKKKGYLGM